MPRLLLIFFLISASLRIDSQVNFDSIYKVIDTIEIPKRKINTLYNASFNKHLTESEINIFRNKLHELGKASGDQDVLAFSYFRTAWLYYYQFKYNEALQEYFEMLKIAENLRDSTLISLANADIGDTYIRMSNKDFAKKHLYYALQYIRKSDKKVEDALNDVYNNLNNVYMREHKYDSALKYCKLRYEFNVHRDLKHLIGRSLGSIGMVYAAQGNNKECVEYFDKALAVLNEAKDLKGASKIYQEKGQLLIKLGQYEQAIEPLKKSIDLSFSSRYTSKYYLVNLYSLADCYFRMKDYKNAAIRFVQYKTLNDSLGIQEADQALSEMSAKYETGKKDSEIAIKKQELLTKSAENSKQRVMIIASVIALLLSFVAIFFVYRSFQLNKRNAMVLAEKNHLIEEKNKEITDSINYAKLIQQSLLASKEMLDRNLTEYFVLYRPKDIVSGDFYWATETKNGFCIACVDCTGHGVPGAFMSLIGKENLDKASSKFEDPGSILSELNRGVKRSLNQDEHGGKDGMDAALLKIRFNAESATLKYAGANRPLWIVREDELKETKATKHAIGGITSDQLVFDEHTIDLKKGDMIYISTDGFADQFGNTNNKKLTTRRFKELLISLSKEKAISQKDKLESFFNEWKGNNEQLDDLLVIGIRV